MWSEGLRPNKCKEEIGKYFKMNAFKIFNFAYRTYHNFQSSFHFGQMKVSDHFHRALGDCFAPEEPPMQICKWTTQPCAVTSTTVLAKPSRLCLRLPFDKRITDDTHYPISVAVWQCCTKQPTHCQIAVWQWLTKQPNYSHCPMEYGCMAVSVHSTANPLSDSCMVVVYKTAECTPIPIVVGNE